MLLDEAVGFVCEVDGALVFGEDVIFRQSVQRKTLCVSLFLGVGGRTVGVDSPIESAVLGVIEVFAEIIEGAVCHLAVFLATKSVGGF